MEKINVYLAGGMFCEGDRIYNALIADKIRQNKNIMDHINLYVPQENETINDKTKCADSNAIFWGDYERLQNTDVLIARIDGDVIPSGTSAEIGIMSQRRQDWEKEKQEVIYYKNIDINSFDAKLFVDKFENKLRPEIIGLCTDSRNPKRTYLDAKNDLMKNYDYESQYCYFNLFTVGCIKANGVLATSVNEVVKALSDYVVIALQKRK